jgi:TPP-dependent trihydroxycyclohexane-1,2-dione (THcHDO) dehydratase
MLLGNGAWWDLGVARASDRPNVRERAAAHEEGARAQRPYV